MRMTDKPILDPCCGGRMFYFDKRNPNVLYCDNREFAEVLCDGRMFEVKPDMLCDFTALPFADETFCHVVFDPPHLIRGGVRSWIVKKYGKLPADWQEYLHKGFSECWRVLKTEGTLIFKWNETQIPVADVIKAIGREPVYGAKCGKQQGTHWLSFVKIEEDSTGE